MPRPHIQVVLGDHAVPPYLREAVRRTGASASFCPLPQVLRGGLSAAADAVVIVVPDTVPDDAELTRCLRVLFDRLADQPRATLLLKAGGGPVPRLGHPRTVPVTFGCGLDAGELTARLTTMLDMRGSLDWLHQGMLNNRRSEETAARRYTNQLRLASQLQREFLPEVLPALGPVSFSVVFRPADYVSGDIYDVHRLDEHHIAVALADATGHGIPAALLTVFIKRALRGKEIENGHYRILRPDEVLARLNEDVLEANLSDCPFVAATYAVLDTATLELTLARAGAPYPILRRQGGTLELLRPAGSVIGVSADARFEVETIRLAPGDALIICSDGLERIVLPPLAAHGMAEAFARAADSVRQQGVDETWGARPAREPTTRYAAAWAGEHDEPPHPDAATAVAEGSEAFGTGARRSVAGKAAADLGAGGNGKGGPKVRPLPGAAVGAPDPATRLPLRSPDEAFMGSPWCQTLRLAGPQAALDQLAIRYEMLRRMGYPLDDLAVVAMQVKDGTEAPRSSGGATGP